MDNQPHNSIIFNVSGCLKEWIIRDYIAGKLPMDMVRQIEMHLSDCPLCADAVEGYMAMPGDKDVNPILESAKKQLFGKDKDKEQTFVVLKGSDSRKKKTTRIIYVSLAASIALLIGSYFVIQALVSNENKTEVAEFEKKSMDAGEIRTPAGPTQADSAVHIMSASGKSGVLSEAQQKVTITEGWRDDIKSMEVSGENNIPVQAGVAKYFNGMTDSILYTDMTLADKTSNSVEEQSKVAAAADKDQKIPDDGLKAEDKEVVLESVTLAGVKKAQVVKFAETKKSNNKEKVMPATGGVIQNAAMPSKAEAGDEINTGVDNYKKGDYPGAINNLERGLQTNPNDDQALYYCGMAYYNNHQQDKALQSFEKITRNPHSQFYEAAKWQTAVIYKETSQKTKAKKVLNEIIDENGTYRQKAVDAVNELNK